MNETTTPRRLTRSRTDRRIAGVAGGIGSYLGIDPAVVRVVLAVLVLAGGSGILVYLIAWVILPEGDDDEPAPPGDRPDVTRVVGVLLAAAAVVLLVDDARLVGDLVLPAVLIGTGIWLITRTRPDVGTDGPTEPLPGMTGAPDSSWSGGGTATMVAPATSAAGAPAGPPVTRITLAILAIGAGVVGLAGAGGADIPLRATLVAGLAVCGLGMVAGGLLGRARGLAVVAIPIVLALSFVSALDLDLSDGIGERTYRPTSVSEVETEYRLGVGSLVLDLRGIDPDEFRGQTVAVDVDSGVGEIVVHTPTGVAVDVESSIALGSNILFGEVTDGADLDDRASRDGAEGAGRLILSVDMGLGEVDVR